MAFERVRNRFEEEFVVGVFGRGVGGEAWMRSFGTRASAQGDCGRIGAVSRRYIYNCIKTVLNFGVRKNGWEIWQLSFVGSMTLLRAGKFSFVRRRHQLYLLCLSFVIMHRWRVRCRNKV